MKRNLVVLILIAALAGIAIYQNFAPSKKTALPKEEAPMINYLAPQTSLEDKEGNLYTIGGQRDKVLLINFWASWCEPCHDEAPDLVYLYEKYGDDLEIYAVNAIEVDTIEKAQNFIDMYGIEFKVLYDYNNKINDLYRVPGYPTNFIVDRDGVIRDVIQGLKASDDLEDRVKKVIKG